jgi:hypothetical protein
MRYYLVLDQDQHLFVTALGITGQEAGSDAQRATPRRTEIFGWED